MTSLKNKIMDRILAIDQERRAYRKANNKTMANCMTRVLNELNLLLKDTMIYRERKRISSSSQ